MSDSRPKIILQAHATRAAIAMTLLLHARERSPRDIKKPLSAMIAGLVVAIVIVVAFYIATRLSAIKR